MFEEFEPVVLVRDFDGGGPLQGEPLRAGDVGVICQRYPGGAHYEVEFTPGDGRSIAVLLLAAADLRRLGAGEIRHMSKLKSAAPDHKQQEPGQAAASRPVPPPIQTGDAVVLTGDLAGTPLRRGDVGQAEDYLHRTALWQVSFTSGAGRFIKAPILSLSDIRKPGPRELECVRKLQPPGQAG